MFAGLVDEKTLTAFEASMTTVWEIDARDGSEETIHGTQKPIECMARPIRNHMGDVYDPFLGSGTTLIAAEQLGRICYGMEISPVYCDVIVKRWETLTGKKAVIEKNERP
jgi:DNA modification methylase